MMLTYDNLLENAKKIVEFSKLYNRLVADDEIDKDTGNHIVFSYVFNPLLFNAIKSGNTKLTKELLDFLENMAKSKDNLVQEVCDFTVLEELQSIIPQTTLYPLLGEKTKEGFIATRQYLKPNNSWGTL